MSNIKFYLLFEQSPVKTITKTTATKSATAGGVTSTTTTATTTKRPSSSLTSTTRTTTTAATKKLTPIKKPATTSLTRTTPSKSSVTTNGSVEKKKTAVTKTSTAITKPQATADTNGNTFDPLNNLIGKINGISLDNGDGIVSSIITTTTTAIECFSADKELINPFANGETNQNAIIDPAAD